MAWRAKGTGNGKPSKTTGKTSGNTSGGGSANAKNPVDDLIESFEEGVRLALGDANWKMPRDDKNPDLQHTHGETVWCDPQPKNAQSANKRVDDWPKLLHDDTGTWKLWRLPFCWQCNVSGKPATTSQIYKYEKTGFGKCYSCISTKQDGQAASASTTPTQDNTNAARAFGVFSRHAYSRIWPVQSPNGDAEYCLADRLTSPTVDEYAE